MTPCYTKISDTHTHTKNQIDLLNENLLTVNGWEGFLSRISQDNRMEFFMAAFTLKLVAKTRIQEYMRHKTINSSFGLLLF